MTHPEPIICEKCGQEMPRATGFRRRDNGTIEDIHVCGCHHVQPEK